MGNVHETETSFPLGLEATHVDIRPPDTDSLEQYQDRDEGRTAPKDGQEVVDYLNRKGGAASPDDIGTSKSPSSMNLDLPPGVFYADLRSRETALSSSASENERKGNSRQSSQGYQA